MVKISGSSLDEALGIRTGLFLLALNIQHRRFLSCPENLPGLRAASRIDRFLLPKGAHQVHGHSPEVLMNIVWIPSSWSRVKDWKMTVRLLSCICSLLPLDRGSFQQVLVSVSLNSILGFLPSILRPLGLFSTTTM